MVLCCELTIDGVEDSDFVLFQKSLYLLGDPAIAELNSALVWCNSCEQFGEGESIATKTKLEKLFNDCELGHLPRYITDYYDATEERIQKFREYLLRCIRWRAIRKSPAKCLKCGSSNIVTVDDTGEEFTDPLGRKISTSYGSADTSIDHVLYIYDAEGTFIGEISRVCPDTNAYIKDDYSAYRLLELLNQAGAVE